MRDDEHSDSKQPKWKLPITTTLWCLIILWGVAVLAGSGLLLTYSTTQGKSGTPPVIWPKECLVARELDVPILLMFVHPKCPCSRASIRELMSLMANVTDELEIKVFMYRPKERESKWSKTDLWYSAASIPGAIVFDDLNGVESKRFGTWTSGHVLLYNAQERLMFSGGLTGRRGHEGNNLGRQSIVKLLKDAASPQPYVSNGVYAQATVLPLTTPVLGCQIYDESQVASKKELNPICQH